MNDLNHSWPGSGAEQEASNPGLLSFTPLFMQLLRARGLEQPEAIQSFLYPETGHLENPFAMKGVREAAEMIRKAARERIPVLIHGDYDVDGITGTALMARTLEKLEAEFYCFLPERSQDGYGVSARCFEMAAEKKAGLLITVDCGITAHKAIDKARSLGMSTIIIDHHRITEQGLPEADIILNPLQSGCAYPFKELSAAGLVFKLSQALLGTQALDFLYLAAISTVCDVAPLTGENRILVKKGLEILSKRNQTGLNALMETGKLKAQILNTGHLGFMIGPRINAAGRMSSPEIALRLLLTGSAREAASLAKALEEENRIRQKEESQVTREACAQVEKTFHFNRDRVIVAAQKSWHAGVIGIAASRLVDRYYRPSIVIAIDGEKGKGSGRSIKGFHLFNALESCRDLFLEFGGHEQASGLSIEAGKIPELRRRINEYAHEKCGPDIFVRKIRADLEIQISELRSVFVRELELLEPHGAGNPRPVFLSRNLTVKTKCEKIYGDTYKFFVTDGTIMQEVLWQDPRGEMLPALAKGARLDLAYNVRSRNRDGLESLSLDAKHILPLN
jgi:single-stranded-DNA-specific exonuclease